MASESEKTASTAPKEEVVENKYELMLILLPDLSKDDIDKEIKKFKKQIKEFKGEIYHEDNWDVRDLAYIIKKHDTGYYVILYFTCPSEQAKHMQEFEKELRLDKSVLRHMLVKSPKGYAIKKLSELELTEEDKVSMRKKSQAEKDSPKMGIKKAAKPVVAAEKPKVEEKPVKEVEKKPKVEEKPVKEVEKKSKVEEKPTAEEEKVEEKPSAKGAKGDKDEKKKKAMDISDLDSQLQSILDDEDMNL